MQKIAIIGLLSQFAGYNRLPKICTLVCYISIQGCSKMLNFGTTALKLNDGMCFFRVHAAIYGAVLPKDPLWTGGIHAFDDF
jgi:hypothetical protein